MAKLAIMLTSGMNTEDVRTVRKIAGSALSQGHTVNIFLMVDGVFNVAPLKDLTLQPRAEIILCTVNSKERGVPGDEAVILGSQCDWAGTAHDSDRVIVFG